MRPCPCYTMPGVKAFSKTLRSRLNKQDHLDRLPVDLVDQLMSRGRTGFPVRNSFIENIAPMTCILGKPKSGKTTLSVLAALSYVSGQDHRVLYLRSERARELVSLSPLAALPASGFREVDRDTFLENQEQILVRDKSSLVINRSCLSDLDMILKHEISDTLVIADELFQGRYGHRLYFDFIPRVSRFQKYLDSISRATRMRPDVQVIISEPAFREYDRDFSELAENYRKSAHHAWLLLEIGQSPTIIHHHDGNVREFGFSCIGSRFQCERRALNMTFPDWTHERLFSDEIRKFVDERMSYGIKIETRVREFLQSAPVITSHSQALEVTSRLLGYSSWHALQGCLRKMDKPLDVLTNDLTRKTR